MSGAALLLKASSELSDVVYSDNSNEQLYIDDEDSDLQEEVPSELLVQASSRAIKTPTSAMRPHIKNVTEVKASRSRSFSGSNAHLASARNSRILPQLNKQAHQFLTLPSRSLDSFSTLRRKKSKKSGETKMEEYKPMIILHKDEEDSPQEPSKPNRGALLQERIKKQLELERQKSTSPQQPIRKEQKQDNVRKTLKRQEGRAILKDRNDDNTNDDANPVDIGEELIKQHDKLERQRKKLSKTASVILLPSAKQLSTQQKDYLVSILRNAKNKM